MLRNKRLENPPVARVHHQYLYKSDVAHLAAEASSPEDHAEMVERYVQSWITKQLMIAAAEACGSDHQAEPERRVLDYRYALLVHNFIEKQINAQLNREVSPEEIEDYYQAHQEDFLLRSPVFKSKFVILPQHAPNKASVGQLLLANDAKKKEKLQDYCLKFAHQHSLKEEGWFQWDELTKATSYSKIKNPFRLLNKSKLLQTSDKEYAYYFKISAYKRANEVSPLALVKEQITDMIVYKRKIDLANKIKEEILHKAQKNNDYVIYE